MFNRYGDRRNIIECPRPRCKTKLRIPEFSESIKLKCPNCSIVFSYPFESKKKKRTGSKEDIKAHPFLFGFLLTIWVIIQSFLLVYDSLTIYSIVFFTIFFSIIWFMVLWIRGDYRERHVKWYFRKIFVLIMLWFFPPVGISLLWAGARFKTASKILFTSLISIWFISIVSFISNHAEFSSSGDMETSYIKETYLHEEKSLRSQFLDEFTRAYGKKCKNEELTIPQIAEKFDNSVVVVKAFDKNRELISQGSGFFITERAIATNYHLIGDAYSASIQLPSQQTYRNIVFLGGDPINDIAILFIPGLEESQLPLMIGNSSTIKRGEKVIAIGNPLGLRNSLSDGLVSGIRDFDGVDLLQITAPISPGSSGGALLNMKGQVIGITTRASLWIAQNLNFAVPINSLVDLINKWKKESYHQSSTGNIKTIKREKHSFDRPKSFPVTKSEQKTESFSLPHGTILLKNADRLKGLGELKVENGTRYDAVLKLVNLDINQSIYTVYIRSKSEYVINKINNGVYKILFCLGNDWDAKNLSFRKNLSFSEFERNFQFTTNEKIEGEYIKTIYTSLEISLHPVLGGTARTDSISEFEFDIY